MLLDEQFAGSAVRLVLVRAIVHFDGCVFVDALGIMDLMKFPASTQIIRFRIA